MDDDVGWSRYVDQVYYHPSWKWNLLDAAVQKITTLHQCWICDGVAMLIIFYRSSGRGLRVVFFGSLSAHSTAFFTATIWKKKLATNDFYLNVIIPLSAGIFRKLAISNTKGIYIYLLSSIELMILIIILSHDLAFLYTSSVGRRKLYLTSGILYEWNRDPVPSFFAH